MHHSYIPKIFVPNLTGVNLEIEQLCVILARDFSLKPAHTSETLESVLANEEEARALNIDRSFPLLMLKDLNKTSTGRIFEYTKVLFRGDKIKLHFEYDKEF